MPSLSMCFWSALSAGSIWFEATSIRAAVTIRPTSAAGRRRGEVDGQPPAVELVTMELLDGGGRRLRRGHLDESVAAPLAGPHVPRQGARFHAPDLAAQLANTTRG